MTYATDEKEHDEYVAMLERDNAALLAALETCRDCLDWSDNPSTERVVLHAIAQAKGE